MRVISIAVFISILAVAFFSGNALAAVVFSDNFDSGASASWGNEVGSWYASGGVYDALYPSNSPLTYSSVTTLPSLTDFEVTLDINDVYDGGLWLRSTDNNHGVLLVTHGRSNTFYWHIVDGSNNWTVYNQAGYTNLNGSDVSLRIVVEGNEYKLYVNGSASPLTTLTTSVFSSGKFALYDFSGQPSAAANNMGQTFDNVVISADGAVVPEPASLSLLGIGLLGLLGLRKRNRSI